MTITHRNYNGTTGDLGGWDISADGLTVSFNASAVKSNGASHDCPLCGATVTDWIWTTDRETNEKVRLEPVNHIAHVRFHARLGF